MDPLESIEPGLPEGLQVRDQFFSEDECRSIENDIETIRPLAEAGRLKRHTVDKAALRSKYFFGYGYTYGAQMGGKGGERLLPPELVDPIPDWVRTKLIAKLEKSGIVSDGWINAVAVTDYQPGGMIVSHVDPPQLFARPICICSFFSTGRLVFGASFSFVAGRSTGPRPPRFIAPMPRGSLVLMDGFAANNISHGIRPVDMDGRRVSIILRHVFIDAPCICGPLAATLPPAQRSARHDTLKRWLLEVDGGEGFLLDHLRQLSARFASPEQVQNAYAAAGDGVGSRLFDELEIRKLGHRRLFMKWFCAQGIGAWR